MKKNCTLSVISILLVSLMPAFTFSQTISLKQLWVKNTSVLTMKFTPDGNSLVTGGIRSDNNSFGQIKIWQASTGKTLDSITNGSMGVTDAVDISKNGQTIISGHGSIQCAGDGACGAVLPGFFKFSIAGRQQLFSNDSVQPVPAIAYSPDNTTIAVGTNANNTGNIRIYDSSFHFKRSLQNNSIESVSLKFTPDGKYLVSGNDSNRYGSVKVWDYTTGKLIRKMTNGDYVTGGGSEPQVDVSPDGKYIAGGGDGYNMATRIWNVSNGKLVYTLTINSGDYYGNNIPVFSPDGKYVFSGIALYSSGIGWHGLIYIWRLSDGKLMQIITDNYGSPQSGGIEALAFSKANNYFAYSVYNELKTFSISGLGTPVAYSPGNDLRITNGASFNTIVFPNPVTTAAIIQYSLPSRQKVAISIYDIQGRKIIDLVNGEKDAGIYTVTFNAAKLTAGIYLYRVLTAAGAESGKIVVSK